MDPRNGRRRVRQRAIQRFLVLWIVPVVSGAFGIMIVAQMFRDKPTRLHLNTDVAPWPLPDRPADRIRAARLPPFEEKGAKGHPHVHVDIFVDGASVALPTGLGLTSSLHTHSSSGIVHMETSNENARFTLGQLFTVWGVRLTDTCVGGYCAPTNPIRVYIDGREKTGDPAQAPLTPYAEIALVIGKPPPRIPAAYDCRGAADLERRSCQGFLDKS